MSVIHFNKETFDKQVLSQSGVALVDFWATWCGPCKMLGPIIDELSEELSIPVGKVNVDDEQDLAAQFTVMSIPTVIVFKDGKEVDRSVGVVPKDKLKAMVENA